MMARLRSRPPIDRGGAVVAIGVRGGRRPSGGAQTTSTEEGVRVGQRRMASRDHILSVILRSGRASLSAFPSVTSKLSLAPHPRCCSYATTTVIPPPPAGPEHIEKTR